MQTFFKECNATLPRCVTSLPPTPQKKKNGFEADKEKLCNSCLVTESGEALIKSLTSQTTLHFWGLEALFKDKKKKEKKSRKCQCDRRFHVTEKFPYLVFCDFSASQLVVVLKEFSSANSVLVNCFPYFLKDILQGWRARALKYKAQIRENISQTCNNSCLATGEETNPNAFFCFFFLSFLDFRYESTQRPP